MLRVSDFAKSFAKDWNRLNRSGRYDMRLLKELMMLLIANNERLEPQWADHALKGDWSDHREYHIGGDFLLIYRLDKNMIILCGQGPMPNCLSSVSALTTMR